MLAAEVGVLGFLIQRSFLGYFVGLWLHKKLGKVSDISIRLIQVVISQV